MALRPKIVKLEKMVGGLSGMANKIDENAPEYYILKCCVTDELADGALAMGLRKERTAEYLAKKVKSVKETHKLSSLISNSKFCHVIQVHIMHTLLYYFKCLQHN